MGHLRTDLSEARAQYRDCAQEVNTSNIYFATSLMEFFNPEIFKKFEFKHANTFSNLDNYNSAKNDFA